MFYDHRALEGRLLDLFSALFGFYVVRISEVIWFTVNFTLTECVKMFLKFSDSALKDDPSTFGNFNTLINGSF